MNTVSKLVIGSIIALSLTSVANAAQSKPETLIKVPQAQLLKLQKPRHHECLKHKRRLGFVRSWHRALNKIEPLTTAQAKTVANAAVALYGDSNMRVTRVTPFKNKYGQQNYKVVINNQQGKALGVLMMNGSNGRIMKIVKR